MEVVEPKVEEQISVGKLSKLKHPPGLYLLFCTEMWERFSYYGLRSLLILYLTATYIQGGLGFEQSSGALIYGWFCGLTYFTPMIGGVIADKYLGQKKAIIVGGLIMAIGNIALFSSQTRIALFIGLFLLIIGNGFFKPNISTVVGQLYPEGDKRKDSAFTIFYMGINVGSLFAPLLCGALAENIFATKNLDVIVHYGFRYGFLAAAIGMIIGQIIFVVLSPKYLSNIGERKVKENKDCKLTAKEKNRPLTKQEKNRTLAILILAAFIIFFWSGFEQAGSSLTIFANKYANRNLFGWTVPVAFFQSINPIFVLILSPIMAKIWISLANRKKGDASVPAKMAFGLIILGIGFLLMVAAVLSLGNGEGSVAKASMWWLVGTYFFNTVGELCLSPIGLSMVSSIAPVKYASLLMGVWLASNGIANLLSGVIASKMQALGQLQIFGGISVFTVLLGVLLLIFNKKIAKLMK